MGSPASIYSLQGFFHILPLGVLFEIFMGKKLMKRSIRHMNGGVKKEKILSRSKIEQKK